MDKSVDLDQISHQIRLDENLRDAVRSGNADIVRALLAAGADPNARNAKGDAPLHVAPRFTFLFCGCCGYVEVVEALLAAGADPNDRNEEGLTPLHCAADCRSVEAVQALAAAGADPNVRNKDGLTLLHQAAARWDSVEVVQALLAAGADPNLRNECLTPLLPHLISVLFIPLMILLYFIHDLSRGRLPLNFFSFVSAAMSRRWDEDGLTPLHAAASNGSMETVHALLSVGADPDAKDAKGRLPEDVAEGQAKKFLSARRAAVSEESDLLACLAPATAKTRSLAL